MSLAAHNSKPGNRRPNVTDTEREVARSIYLAQGKGPGSGGASTIPGHPQQNPCLLEARTSSKPHDPPGLPEAPGLVPRTCPQGAGCKEVPSRGVKRCPVALPEAPGLPQALNVWKRGAPCGGTTPPWYSSACEWPFRNPHLPANDHLQTPL